MNELQKQELLEDYTLYFSKIYKTVTETQGFVSNHLDIDLLDDVVAMKNVIMKIKCEISKKLEEQPLKSPLKEAPPQEKPPQEEVFEIPELPPPPPPKKKFRSQQEMVDEVVKRKNSVSKGRVTTRFIRSLQVINKDEYEKYDGIILYDKKTSQFIIKPISSRFHNIVKLGSKYDIEISNQKTTIYLKKKTGIGEVRVNESIGQKQFMVYVPTKITKTTDLSPLDINDAFFFRIKNCDKTNSKKITIVYGDKDTSMNEFFCNTFGSGNSYRIWKKHSYTSFCRANNIPVMKKRNTRVPE